MAMAIKKQAAQAFPKTRPEKRPNYLAWLHRLPCAVTGIFAYGVEAAHVSFADPWYGHYGRAKGTKAPDQFAVPLSPAEHRKQHGMDEETYWLNAGIDPHQLALTLWAIYSMYSGEEAVARANARIHAGIRKAEFDK